MADSTTKVSEIPSENIKGILSYEDLYDRCCKYEQIIEQQKAEIEFRKKDKHRSEEDEELMDSMTRTITGMKEMNDKLNATVDVLIGKIKE